MGCLAQIITLPYPVYHKKFVEVTAQDITDAIKKRLIGTSDQALRNVRKEQVDAIIKSVENISRRVLNKDDREKQSEVLRLELCNKSLISNYLERRISGIRDLS
jgi:plasmid replication initiation protein